MNAPGSGDRYIAEVHGGVSGQFVQGRQNHQVMINRDARQPVTDADLAEVRRLVDGLKRKVAAEAPPERRDAALERIDELQDAVVADQPDVDVMSSVRKWFTRNLPKLAGAVTSLIVHPLVGHVVQSAGELAASEFRQRFGDEAP